MDGLVRADLDATPPIVRRIQMMLLVGATGAVGFVCSFVLLHFGVDRMWARYPIAVGVAYLAFLFFVWVWLAHQRRSASGQRTRIDPLDAIGPPDLPDLGRRAATKPFEFVGGGRFGGGGAGGHFEVAPTIESAAADSTPTVAECMSLPKPVESAGSVLAELAPEELWLVVVAAAAAVGVLVASLYMIYVAPVFFAEILVDGALAGGLYARLRDVEQQHWTVGAVRRTWVPVTVVTVVFLVAGYLMQLMVPEARSIGAVWTALTGA